jgi:glycosyltransferase involved in cell wall biosynthesis
MRILHVTDTFLPKVGGAEIAIDQLVRAMSDLGDQCAVVAQRPRGLGREIDTPYPLFRYLNPRSSLWAGWWIDRRLKWINRQIGPFDAVIGHHAFPPGYAVVRFAQRHGVSSIVYPRGGDIYEVSRFRRKKRAWRKLTWALANASAVVCASAAMEQIVREIIGERAAAGGRIVRIPNGVNLQEMRRDSSTSKFASDTALACPFVLGLGRLIRRKGFHLLIDAFAFAAAAAELPAGWKLVIAGDGRELQALRAQARPLGDRVLFTGLVGGADKRWLLQNCRFMAAPSLEESFGNVALEAMACAKPVIASRASGFAEIVRDDQNGRLIEVGRVDSLKQAIQAYVKADLSVESARAVKTAEAFSWSTIALMYRELAQRLKVAQVPRPAGREITEATAAGGGTGGSTQCF